MAVVGSRSNHAERAPPTQQLRQVARKARAEMLHDENRQGKAERQRTERLAERVEPTERRCYRDEVESASRAVLSQQRGHRAGRGGAVVGRLWHACSFYASLDSR